MQSDEACNVILKVVNNVAALRANFIDGLLVQECARESVFAVAFRRYRLRFQ